MPRDETLKKLDALSDRLAELLSRESDPQAAMRGLSRRLLEEDLSQHSPAPQESPAQFAQTVIRENPAMYDLVSDLALPNLSAIETADELVSRLLPSHYDHG